MTDIIKIFKEQSNGQYLSLKWLINMLEEPKSRRYAVKYLYVKEDRIVSTNGKQLGEIKLEHSFTNGFYSVIAKDAKSIILELARNTDAYEYPEYEKFLTPEDTSEVIDLEKGVGERFMKEPIVSSNFCRVVKLLPERFYLYYDLFREVIQINTLSKVFIDKKSWYTIFEGEGYGFSYRALLTPAIYPKSDPGENE